MKKFLQFLQVSPTTDTRYGFVDGMRGIAILAVIYSHVVFFPISGTVGELLICSRPSGANGVTLFFTLSGFLISYPFFKRKRTDAQSVVPASYARRRLAKIWPPLVASLVLLTPLAIWKTGDWSLLKTAIEWSLLLPTVFPVSGSLNPVMWSLICELQFYILCPLLFLLFRKRSFHAAATGVPVILFCVPFAARLIYLSHGMVFSLRPTIDLNFPSFMDQFAFGTAFAAFYASYPKNAQWARWGNVGLLALAPAFAMATVLRFWKCPDPLVFEVERIIFGLIATSLLFYLYDTSKIGARLLANPFLCIAGLVSYEWYLLHQALGLWLLEAFGSTNGNPGAYLVKILLVVGTSFLAAFLIYRWISLPILRRVHDRK